MSSKPISKRKKKDEALASFFFIPALHTKTNGKYFSILDY